MFTNTGNIFTTQREFTTGNNQFIATGIVNGIADLWIQKALIGTMPVFS
jgi:hypothetical protein